MSHPHVGHELLGTTHTFVNDLVSICIPLENSYWLVYCVCVIPWYIGDLFFLPGISVAMSVVVVCILLAIPIILCVCCKLIETLGIIHETYTNNTYLSVPIPQGEKCECEVASSPCTCTTTFALEIEE